MQQFDVGVIGAGNIGRIHAERVAGLGHNVAAVADIIPEVREQFATEYGVRGQYEDYERMLEEATLDVVVVAVPNSLHGDCAVAALERDVNVMVEKPLAHSLEDAERIADAEADSDAELMVGFKMAFLPTVEVVADAAQDGEFGDVYEVSVEYVRQRGIPQLGSWFTQKSLSGGGALIDIGVHMIHLAMCVLDFPEVETVSAATGSHFGTKEEYTYLNMWGGQPTDPDAFDVDDSARAFIRTADGARINVNVNWASNTESKRVVEVRGDEAGATFQPTADTVTVYGTKGDALTETEIEPPSKNSFVGEWTYFFEVLAGEREHTRNTVEEGITIQRLLHTIYESDERRAEISL